MKQFLQLMNKAEPNRESFESFEKLMEDYRQLLADQVKGTVDIEIATSFIKELIENQDSDGYWRLIFSVDMPYEAKVYHWKYPTILFTSLLISFYLLYPVESAQIQGMEAVLVRALDIVEKGKLTGHGFESFQFMMNSLDLLVQAGVMQFITVFPVAHKGFTHFILDRKKGLESALEEGKTKHDFDEDFRIRIEDMICKMNSEQKAWLFVYGTLMKSNSYQGYVGDYEFRGKASLTGYALYDLGQYPGIIEDKEERVEGELLCIDEDKLADIDAYEAEGCLYKRKMVKVHTQQDEPVEAFTYVYNKSLDGKRKIPFSFQPWYLGISDILDEYVWYACYGSNIKRERFMKYINQCEDNTPPRMERPRMLNHPIYFAKKSNTWQNKGVAFLDFTKRGSCYGKMYLITKEQLVEIQHHEGPVWYNNKAQLGYEDGLPIYTLTHSPRWEQDTIPSEAYISVIKEGIRDCYPHLSNSGVDDYLLGCILKK